MKPLIIANWKMNLGVRECVELAQADVAFVKSHTLHERLEVVLCPPAIALMQVADICRDTPVSWGAQNMFWHERGAYTGEIGPASLIETGCSYVIVGHSERRKYLGETDEMVNRKVTAALHAGLTPIVCVGETMEQRHEQRSDLTVMSQVIEAFRGITLGTGQHVVVAYEPVWVIGTGQAIEPAEAEHMSQVIHQALVDLFPIEVVTSQTRVIYGGSVDAHNIQSFMRIQAVSGALVGTASVSREKFIALLETF